MQVIQLAKQFVRRLEDVGIGQELLLGKDQFDQFFADVGIGELDHSFIDQLLFDGGRQLGVPGFVLEANLVAVSVKCESTICGPGV